MWPDRKGSRGITVVAQPSAFLRFLAVRFVYQSTLLDDSSVWPGSSIPIHHSVLKQEAEATIICGGQNSLADSAAASGSPTLWRRADLS